MATTDPRGTTSLFDVDSAAFANAARAVQTFGTSLQQAAASFEAFGAAARAAHASALAAARSASAQSGRKGRFKPRARKRR